MPRKPIGERPMTDAERRAAYRARQADYRRRQAERMAALESVVRRIATEADTLNKARTWARMALNGGERTAARD